MTGNPDVVVSVSLDIVETETKKKKSEKGHVVPPRTAAISPVNSDKTAKRCISQTVNFSIARSSATGLSATFLGPPVAPVAVTAKRPSGLSVHVHAAPKEEEAAQALPMLHAKDEKDEEEVADHYRFPLRHVVEKVEKVESETKYPHHLLASPHRGTPQRVSIINVMGKSGHPKHVLPPMFEKVTPWDISFRTATEEAEARQETCSYPINAIRIAGADMPLPETPEEIVVPPLTPMRLPTNHNQ